ncbi:MAG: hypothetical protein HY812_22200 [Planctomycetes bacterium]|nr:hypothetical protein [Planctomycetota bacterium]
MARIPRRSRSLVFRSRLAGAGGLAALAAVAFPSAEAATWIVDAAAGPGFHYTDIPPAVVAAAPNDMIVVRTGVYNAFALTKPLIVMAETGHDPDVSGDSAVSFLPAGSRAVLSGLDLKHLHVHDCQGTVHVDDWTSTAAYLKAMLWIERCRLVTVSRCHLDHFLSGGGTPDRTGATIDQSTVVISSSSFLGSDGWDGWDSQPAEDGAPGIDARSSTVYVQASSSRGGNGGWYYDMSGWSLGPGDGGHGIKLAKCKLHLFGRPADSVAGGVGGESNYGVKGASGAGVWASSSSVAYSGINLGSVSTSGGSTVVPVQPDVPVLTLCGSGEIGGLIELTLRTGHFSQYVILVSDRQTVVPQATTYTDLLVGPAPTFVLAAGYIAAPPVELSLPLAAALAPYRGLQVHFQANVLTKGGKPYLSTSDSFVLR